MFWVDITANVIFLFDLIVHFFVSYIDTQQGVEIFSPKLIALHYLKTEFLYDFISTLPLKSIGVSIFGI